MLHNSTTTTAPDIGIVVDSVKCTADDDGFLRPLCSSLADQDADVATQQGQQDCSAGIVMTAVFILGWLWNTK